MSGQGHIERRGKTSWRIKIELENDPVTGKRRVGNHSFRGTKKEAGNEMTRLLSELNSNKYVDPSKTTVWEFFVTWERDWASVGNNLGLKTLERYRELINLQIVPHIGGKLIQKLQPADLVALYAKLAREGRKKGGGLAPRTIAAVHRVLHRALGHACKWRVVSVNVADGQLTDPPKVPKTEIQILMADEVLLVLNALREVTLYPIILFALSSGARRGEILAIRWKDIDFDRATARIERSLEETKGGKKLRFKEPKTPQGRRNISLPAELVSVLRSHWKDQQEHRLALGMGKAAPDDLVFAADDGGPMIPRTVSREWLRVVVEKKLPKVNFHALRHTHVSQLIDSGMDVLTISKRIGHAGPHITLSVYGHLFKNNDTQAARVMDAAFANIGTTTRERK
jgi:integrase